LDNEKRITEFAIIHCLDRVKGLGPVKFRQIYETYRSFSAFWEDATSRSYDFKSQRIDFDVKFQKNLVKQLKSLKRKLRQSRNYIAEQMNKAKKLDGKLISYFDKEYPPNLYKTNQCVPILYAAGNLEILRNEESCAVVGTRNPSEWSKIETRSAVEELIKQGYVIVSGLAKGIDAIAHETALANNAKTISVLGCGVDVYYPKENQKLQDEIRRKGVIVSEYPFGSRIQLISLQKRDKIIVGLSKHVLIAETSKKGGTMNAYRAALEQKKPIGVFIPSPQILGNFDGNIEIAKEMKTKVYRFSNGNSVNFRSESDAQSIFV
jgi:DNA processing protein